MKQFTIKFVIFAIIFGKNNVVFGTNDDGTSSKPTSIINANLTCEEFCASSYNQNYPWTQIKEYQKEKSKQSIINEDYLKKTSIIFGLSEIANKNYLNTLCYQQFKEIRNGILQKDVWAMKVLDSSGTKKSGFLWGDNYWLGSKEGCETVKKPISITLSKQFKRIMKMELIHNLSPFDIEYRVLYIKHNSPWQVEIKCMPERIIHIGLCLPKICTIPEIYNITKIYFDNNMLEDANIYDLKPEIINIKNFELNENFFNKLSIKIIIGFLVFTILMMICAACLADSLSINNNNNNNSTNINDLLNENNEKIDNELHSLQNFVQCYDLIDNFHKLFTFNEQSFKSIPIINGLRSISCFWIMAFHVIWFMYFTIDNKTFVLLYAEKFFYQYISTAPLLVDIFFTISGFLVTYNFLKNPHKIDQIRLNSIWMNCKEYGKLILHRYLRLAPLYLVVIVMVDIFTAYSEDISIFYILDRNDKTCTKFWWRNLLFIQSFFDYQELCLNWTWSVACEMQYFCLAILLIFVYIKNADFAKVLFIVGLISTIIWSFISGYRSQYQLSFDVVYHTGSDIYINPFVRILPYFLGCGAGWFLATTKGQFTINKTTEKCFWNLAIIIFFICIFSTVKRDINVISTLSLLIFGRIYFSGAICWMIIGSATGRNVWWSRFLECQIFQHLNKLSYAIYLLNPFVISLVFSLSKTSTHFDPILLCVLTCGFAIIIYIASIVFSLLFEIPYCNLSNYILKGKTKEI